ncbi:MAG: sigma-54-dependent Fis family transcriptional regulator [Gemmatimonadales bacterium]|nr:sigma-54-dependent Fis family transcriptional regulator [Gemmatimonadales bacterium]
MKDGPPVVLLADDQPDVLEALRLLLKAEGFLVQTAHVPEGVMAILERSVVDAALIDLNYTRDTTSGREGLDLLSRIRAHDPTLPVIVMTAWGSVDKAVEAMRVGARDFIEKPWDNARLLTTLRTQIELARALRAATRLEQENRLLRNDGLPELIAESAVMRPILQVMERIAPSDANILITGEHGTGKEVVARWIHAASRRADKPLVIVNAGGLPEGVFESELFGHVKGAFTDAKTDRIGRFEMASGGTLFLDEIANIGMAQQARLLRVLQTGELERVGSSVTRRVDVRVLAATNANLQAEVAAGRFREDLLFRLNTIEIKLPGLRERREDIRALAAHFLSRYGQRYQRPRTGFSDDAMQALLSYDWPGNIRELDHAIERAVLLSQGERIEVWDLGLPRRGERSAGIDEPQSLDDLERDAIKQALARFDGNVSLAAKSLGVSRSALYRRLQRFGLSPS